MGAVQAQNLLWSQNYKIKGICSIGNFYNFLLSPFFLSIFSKEEDFARIIFDLFG